MYDNKIVEPDEKPRNVEEIIIPPEKREEILNELRLSIKLHYKISKLQNGLTVSKFVTRKLIEINDLSSGLYFVNKNKDLKIQC